MYTYNSTYPTRTQAVYIHFFGLLFQCPLMQDDCPYNLGIEINHEHEGESIITHKYEQGIHLALHVHAQVVEGAGEKETL